ncbi:hypothetical protein WMY93_006878 [Mugilogobius chulae]|uniref:Uncharacterized protein n=1 Tax=Mugilogobius chulae TaxID=88201 RepID=A0AAW0Q0T9_9GOBI
MSFCGWHKSSKSPTRVYTLRLEARLFFSPKTTCRVSCLDSDGQLQRPIRNDCFSCFLGSGCLWTNESGAEGSPAWGGVSSSPRNSCQIYPTSPTSVKVSPRSPPNHQRQ